MLFRSSKDNTLVGIITSGDILKAFVEFFGYHEQGTRIVLDVKENKVGIISALAQVFTDANINISHFLTSSIATNEFILRCDEPDKKKVEKLLESHGFKVVSIL